MNLSVDAAVQPDGSVSAKVTCDGQQATLVFNGSTVRVDVPQPAQAPGA